MYSQSNFLKLSGLLLVGALLIVSGFSGANVQAFQATAAATMSSGGAAAATMAGTMSGGAGLATMAGTMGAGGAIPPCPTAMMATAGAMGTMSASGTMAATSMMAGTMAATPMMAATMAGTMAMMGTPGMAATMHVMPGMTMAGCVLTTKLSGSAEVPNPGDPKAGGTATLMISRPATGPGEVCFNISVTGIKLPAAAAHIHKGAAGVAGPVVVPFSAPDDKGMAMGCTEGVDAALIYDILTEPQNYYVNVHNTDFPNGAARGQLTSAAG